MLTGPLAIEIEIPGRPVPWQRATPVKVRGKTVPLTPKATREFQKAVKALGKVAMRGRPPLSGPLRLNVTAYLPKPKTVSRDLPHVWGSGDVDNYGKSAQDALNGIAFEDDAQICDLNARKRYGEPRLVIIIEPM